MRRLDRYIGPLVIFTIGYILCLTIAHTWRVGEMHITLNGVAHLWSVSATPLSFWTYIVVVGVIGLAFAALGIYSAVSAYRITDPSRLQPTGSLVFLRLLGLWFLIVLLIVTYTSARKWV